MKRGDKLGQFYLISAIIIAVIVIGIVAVTNYSRKQDYTVLNSLRDEIQIESARVLDHAINQELTQTQTNSLMNDFTQKYIDSESRDKSLYFLFGKQNNMTLKGYQLTGASVWLGTAQVTNSQGAFLSSIDPPGSSIALKINEDSHTFPLNAGENFYFVISSDLAGEKYVVTG